MSMKNDNKTNFIKLSFINLVLLLVVYGGFFREGFGADTISQHAIPLINIETWITYGRYFAYLYSYALYLLGINTVEHYQIFFVFFMINTALALTFYQLMFMPFFCCEKKDSADNTSVKSSSFSALLPLIFSSALIYINGLFCESFMFPECFPGFSLAFLFSSIGAYLISKEKNLPGLFVLCVSALFYQAPLMIAAIAVVGYFYFENDFEISVKLFSNSLLIIFFCAAVAFLSTISGGLFAEMLGDTPKPVEFLGVKEEIKNVIYGLLIFLKSGYRLLPPMFLPLLAILFAIIVFAIKESNIKKIISLILVAAAWFGTAMILSRGAEMPRLLGGLYAATAMLFMAAAIGGSKGLKLITTVVMVIFMCIQAGSVYKIMINHYKSNAIDLSDAGNVYEEILSYEKETGNEIKNVAWTTDENISLTNEGIYYRCGQINERTLPLVAYSLLTYVSDGREYKKVKMDKTVFKEHFEGQDWNSFDASKQLVFDGDTLYWCVY